MNKIYWDFEKFSISMESKYQNLYAVENDLNLFFGSENFGGFGDNDWFLLSKKNNEIEFLSLTVPAYFEFPESNFMLSKPLVKLTFKEVVNGGDVDIKMQERAFFFSEKDCLLVTSNSNSIVYEAEVFDGFSLLFDVNKKNVGFLLLDATKKIPGFRADVDNKVFKEYLKEILSICNQDSYDLMDDENENILKFLNSLEKKCIGMSNIDSRINSIISYIKLTKYTFYDIGEF